MRRGTRSTPRYSPISTPNSTACRSAFQRASSRSALGELIRSRYPGQGAQKEAPEGAHGDGPEEEHSTISPTGL